VARGKRDRTENLSAYQAAKSAVSHQTAARHRAASSKHRGVLGGETCVAGKDIGETTLASNIGKNNASRVTQRGERHQIGGAAIIGNAPQDVSAARISEAKESKRYQQ